MSKINRHPVRRTAAGVLAGALALSGAVATALPANAAAGFGLERLAGDNRYETSARIAAEFGATTGAILASGETGHVVDALSANFLAGVRQQPVLLTTRDAVPASVMARLNALTGAKTVTIVGGTAAVSTAVETSLRGMGFTVDRLAGDDRFATSEAIIKAGASSASPIGLVASGTSFPDALAGGPLSYKGKHPVFLTSGGGLPQDTIDAMVAAGTRQVIILGGTSAVPASVQAALEARGITVVTRLGGAGRSETSRLIADYLITSQGFSNTTFNVASGAPRGEGADALSGAALSGKENRVLLVTDNETSAAPVVAFADARATTLTAVGDIFGGTAAVAAALETSVEQAGTAAGRFETLNVAPTTSDTRALANENDTATASSDNRSYTVSGLDDALRYRITLVNGASIQGTGASRTFLSSAIGTSPETFAVDTGTDIADITAVGGIDSAISNTGGANTFNTATVKPVNGSITFTIDGAAAGTVVPVVYVDGGQGGTATTGGASNRLETSATAAGGFAAATETFGVGGATVYVQPAAAAGTIASAVIETVNKDGDQFATGSFNYTYDSNDVFEVDGVRVTQAVFESNLSAGDTITGTVATDASLPSTYRLADNDPVQGATPTAVVGTGASSNDVTVTVTVPTGVDSVQFQRALVTNNVTGTFSTIATEPATDDVATTNGVQVVLNDNDLAVGTYAYRVAFVNDGDTGAPSASVNATTTSPTAADTTAPTILDARVGTNSGSAFLLDSGDTFLLALSEAAAAPSNGDTIRVTDADGTVVDIVAAGGNFALNATTTTINGTAYAAGRVLTVTRGTDVQVVAGSQAGLGLPATITAQAGTTDVAGNQLNIAGSADVVVDTESGTVEEGAPADTTAPTITSARAVSDTSVVVTLSEAVTISGGGAPDDNFFYKVDGTGGGVRASSAALTNPTTITLTFPAATVATGVDANDALTYDDVNAAVDAGDPVDAAGNQLANGTVNVSDL